MSKSNIYWRNYIFSAVGWSLLIGLSLTWNTYQVYNNMLSTAAAEARTNINKDISFRKWATARGGVYVSPTEATPPNPYLKVSDRDVVTTTGKTLTLMNPAYILRDLQTNFGDNLGSKSHITSLQPLNPNNVADDWETKALYIFEQGNRELLEKKQINNQPYLRLMLPLIVEQGCLTCHAVQGYKLGDIRGGISTSIALASYLSQEQKQNIELILSHGLIWIIGLIGQGLSYEREYRLNAKRKLAEIKLQDYQLHLEELVQARTTELLKAKNAAEAANIAKSTFIATMSHELRTPLNAVLGFSELMSQDEAATEIQKNSLNIINRSGAHLLSMINDVLDISKIEAGHFELDSDDFDLFNLLHDIANMVSVHTEAKGLDFDLQIAPNSVRAIHADSGKLRQVLINLLGNAIKFTQYGNVILRIQTQPLPVHATIRLSIEVIDSGIGISEAEQAQLFKPFVQLVQENADIKGTGLGLAISKSLTELMGGCISVSSQIGVGSTFKIELPVSLANADVLAVEQEFAVKCIAPNQPLWRLLIVDDNADNRLLLATILSNVGFQVREAENGQQAINAFEQWQPHLIWMDMRMPIMDGYQATANIRQLAGGDKVKIIALTASVFKEQHQHIINSGCNAVLHKPFQMSEIFAMLKKQLGIKFVYRETSAPEALVIEHITVEMLSKLPLALRQQLHQAALNLDTEETAFIIAQIRNIDPDIADALQELASAYQFEQLIEATDDC